MSATTYKYAHMSKIISLKVEKCAKYGSLGKWRGLKQDFTFMNSTENLGTEQRTLEEMC